MAYLLDLLLLIGFLFLVGTVAYRAGVNAGGARKKEIAEATKTFDRELEAEREKTTHYRDLVQEIRSLSWDNRDVSPELAIQIEDTIKTTERKRLT